MTTPRRPWHASLLLALAAAIPARAEDVPSYQEIASRRSEFDGKVVRFQFTMNRVAPSVQPSLAFRGISDKTHIEIVTPTRPAREGGALLLLVPVKSASLVEQVRSLERRQAIVVTGRVQTLTADSGAIYYYVEVSRVESEPSGDTPEEGTRVDTGEGDAYADAKFADIAADPEAFDGKRIKVTISFGGFERGVPTWACRLAKLSLDSVVAVKGGAPGAALLVPRSATEASEVLATMAIGDRVILAGICRATKVGAIPRTVLVVEKAQPAKD